MQVPLSSQATATTSVQCPTQADVDATAALLCDDDVRRAYVERPRASIDRELDELLTVNHIGVWNRSFGKPSRAATEAALLEAGCGKIDLGEYLATKGELDATYDACHPAQGYLEVLAAGNDGSRLDGPEDQEGCRDRRPTSIVVGSYGRSLKRSAFTNYGRCVDVFAPGEDIVATLPDGWLMPMSGTSYSAPLMARWVSLRNDDTFSPTEARNAVLALADRRRRIPEDQFPSELVYSGDPEAVGDEATTGPNEQTQAAGSETRVVNSLEWRRALWPVVAARK